MAIRIVTILLLTLPFSLVGQGFSLFSDDDMDNEILQIFWKVDKDRIWQHETDTCYFFKVIAIRDSEEHSELEGDVYDILYLLVGEYGEYPEGCLYQYSERSLRNVTSILFSDTYFNIIEEHGEKSDTTTVSFTKVPCKNCYKR